MDWSDFEIGVGSSELRASVSDEGALVFERNGVPILRLPLGALRLGVVPALDDSLNYDPWFFEEGVHLGSLYSPPEGLAWHASKSIAAEGLPSGGLRVELSHGDGISSTVEIVEEAPGRLRLVWTAAVQDGAPAYFRLRVYGDPTEGFYGLGEVFDHVDHRGRVRAMQFEPAPVESAYNEAHVPVPFLVGTSGWGLFVETHRPGVFDVATEAPDLVETTWGLGFAYSGGLWFHVMAADHPLDLLRHYYDETGYPGPVSPSALGPWIWRDEVDGQDAVQADLETIRDHDLATTGYWIDRPYASGENSFDFEPGSYPDPAAMMTAAADRGFAMALWHTPYLDPKDEATASLHEEAASKGWFPPLLGAAVAEWGPPLDFSNPGAVAFWRENLVGYQALGVAGYKLDYGEEVIAGAVGVRIPWRFADGTDELTMHRRYSGLYHQAYRAMLPAQGGFLLVRAGSYGGHLNDVVVWPGDIDATFARFGEEVVRPDGSTYTSVGGLPAAVVAGSSLSVSGYPLFGSDTGGYRNSPPSKEVYVRWFQHTALSTVMQVGTNTNDLPWSFGDRGVLDPEILTLYRESARLHLRLFPYLWTLYAEVRQLGRPIQRPLGLAHPELGVHPDHVYLLGDRLLVAAVTEAGVTSLDVPLPAGTWHDLGTGEAYEGPGSPAVPAPLERIPALLRAGSPLPLLRPTIDTLLEVSDPVSIDSYATTPDPLHVLVAEGPPGTLTLFDGTTVSQSPGAADPATTVLSRDPGDVFQGPVVFELFAFGPLPPGSVTAGDVPLPPATPEGTAEGFWHDPAARGGTVFVRLGPATIEAVVRR